MVRMNRIKPGDSQPDVFILMILMILMIL